LINSVGAEEGKVFKIGEFSQLGQVTIRTLRHYDEMALLKPAYTDPDSDYRYYTIEQLPRLNRIIALKELGLSLEQIARLLDDPVSAEQLRHLLALRQAELAQQIEATQAQLARVAGRLRQIEQEGTVSPYEVARKSVPAQTVATIHQIVPTLADMPHYRCAFYDEIYDWLAQQRIKPCGPELALYHNEDYTERDVDMEVGIVVPAAAVGRESGRVQVYELPAAPTLASTTHYGSLWDVCYAIIAVVAWTGANNYAANGPFRELHLFGRENDLFQEKQLVIEMQLPIQPR
jgi:DNA-binding transcriptional MerR regulator